MMRGGELRGGVFTPPGPEGSVNKALVHACQWGDLGTMTSLLSSDTYKHLTNGERPISLLSYALIYMHESLALWLLENGADPAVGHVNPLEWAARRGYNGVLEAMLRLWPDIIDRRNREGATALWVCATRRDDQAIAILIRHGADASLVGPDGSLPLQHVRYPSLSYRLLEDRQVQCQRERERHLCDVMSHPERVVIWTNDQVLRELAHHVVWGLNSDLQRTLLGLF